jgi:asparagine synthase (glutamine-hydrolysing)
MDQPSIDGINTWYASKAVAELGLKVVVSGVGGDELFQGYTTFAQLPRLVSLWRNVSKVPGAVHLARRVAALQARRSRNPRWKLLPALLLTVEGAWFARRSLFSPEELPKLMGDDLVDELAARLDPASIVRGMTGALACNSRLALGQIESMTYLRNQLLRDSDWASMDHSVELRTPLVDWFLLREVQAVLGNFERFPRKQLLAYAPKTPLASDTVRRTKTGFGIPVQHWLAQLGRTDPEDAVSRGWARQLVKGIYAV